MEIGSFTAIVVILAFFAFGLSLIGCDDDDDDDDDSDDDDDDSDDDDDDDDDDNDDDDDDDDDTVFGEEEMEGWVVGYSYAGGSNSSVIWHDDHGSWSTETVPSMGAPNQLNDVFFLSPDNGWAVGYETNGTTSGVILHRDAAGWSKVALPGDPCRFSQVEFLDADHGWAVCEWINETLAYRYDTGTWSSLPFPIGLYDPVIFYDVSLLAFDHAFLTGLITVPSGSAMGLEYLNGLIVGWMPSSYFDWYEGLQTADGSEGYAAYCKWRASFYPVEVYEFNGSAWSVSTSSPDAGCISDFARSPGGTWYAAGYDYLPSVHRKQGKGWTEMPLPSVCGSYDWNGLTDIKMPADDFGVAVGGARSTGEKGYAFRFNGNKWHSIDELLANFTTYTGASFVYSP